MCFCSPDKLQAAAGDPAAPMTRDGPMAATDRSTESRDPSYTHALGDKPAHPERAADKASPALRPDSGMQHRRSALCGPLLSRPRLQSTWCSCARARTVQPECGTEADCDRPRRESPDLLRSQTRGGHTPAMAGPLSRGHATRCKSRGVPAGSDAWSRPRQPCASPEQGSASPRAEALSALLWRGNGIPKLSCEGPRRADCILSRLTVRVRASLMLGVAVQHHPPSTTCLKFSIWRLSKTHAAKPASNAAGDGVPRDAMACMSCIVCVLCGGAPRHCLPMQRCPHCRDVAARAPHADGGRSATLAASKCLGIGGLSGASPRPTRPNACESFGPASSPTSNGQGRAFRRKRKECRVTQLATSSMLTTPRSGNDTTSGRRHSRSQRLSCGDFVGGPLSKHGLLVLRTMIA